MVRLSVESAASRACAAGHSGSSTAKWRVDAAERLSVADHQQRAVAEAAKAARRALDQWRVVERGVLVGSYAKGGRPPREGDGGGHLVGRSANVATPVRPAFARAANCAMASRITPNSATTAWSRWAARAPRKSDEAEHQLFLRRVDQHYAGHLARLGANEAARASERRRRSEPTIT